MREMKEVLNEKRRKYDQSCLPLAAELLGSTTSCFAFL